MKTCNRVIHKKLVQTKNVVTKSSFESILASRALRGDTEALKILTDWLKWGK